MTKQLSQETKKLLGETLGTYLSTFPFPLEGDDRDRILEEIKQLPAELPYRLFNTLMDKAIQQHFTANIYYALAFGMIGVKAEERVPSDFMKKLFKKE